MTTQYFVFGTEENSYNPQPVKDFPFEVEADQRHMEGEGQNEPGRPKTWLDRVVL